MSAVGIVAEYNPLHNGHRYHIEESRRITGADAVVCVMSGDYVQRGEPAVLDKWERASIALHNGVDVVIEIPAVFCLCNASIYASSSVYLLESLGCVDYLSFGSESGDISRLRIAASMLSEHEDDIDSAIRSYAREGYSYPVARKLAYEAVTGNDADILDGSNNVLAIEYLKSINRLEPRTVKREGAGYNDEYTGTGEFQSSTGIRGLIRSGQSFNRYVPYDDCDIRGKCLMDENAAFDLIRYRIISADACDIDDAPSGGEGIGNRLKDAVRRARSIDELILATKSKRYTYTRISRLLYQILLGVHRDMAAGRPEYIRVLGLTRRGAQLLRQVKDGELNSLPIIENINKTNYSSDMLDLDIYSSDVYNLITGRDVYDNSDYKKSPIICFEH